MPLGTQASELDAQLKEKFRLTKPKARVTQVIDGQTLVINNTETLHLPAIYIPWEFDRDPGEYGKRAKDFVDENFNDKFIRVYQSRNKDRGLLNALGHSAGYITRADDSFFAQVEMVRAGIAFAYPTQTHFEIADMLYEAENEARTEKRGFWADDTWQIMDEVTAMDTDNRFAIIEGKVKKVASRNNIIYLNFGDNWRDDMTVAVNSSLRREFSKVGMNIMQLGGQTIRARGWVRQYNGPYMEIFHPSQIQVIEKNDLFKE
jgi:micrococcal nuclease